MKIIPFCLTLCNPMDCTVHGILQARILEWVAFLSPGDLPNLGIEPRSPALQEDSLPTELSGKPQYFLIIIDAKYLTQCEQIKRQYIKWIIHYDKVAFISRS